jgi:chemotaxis receptor (MCP) glutamine deamidase CheD
MAADLYQVGRMNVETALSVLGQNGIVPVESDVGGCAGRVLLFDTVTGEASIERLP